MYIVIVHGSARALLGFNHQGLSLPLNCNSYFFDILSSHYCHMQTSLYCIFSHVPSLPFPNTSLRKREKSREINYLFLLNLKPVKQGDWSQGYCTFSNAILYKSLGACLNLGLIASQGIEACSHNN